jgi:methyl-accepting chemotaxis protein
VIRSTLAIALASLAVLAAGCGDDEDPAQAWADGFCSSLTTWSESIKSSVDPITSGDLSSDAVNGAVDDVKTATDKLKSDLEGLGAPNTDSGEQAQQQATDLADQLTTAEDTISKAFEGADGTTEMLAAAGVAVSSLTTIVAQMKTTLDDLEQSSSDTSDELRSAFKSSDECKSVRDQLDKLPGGG